MLSLWAILTETDVEAYAGTLVLPSYLAHLCLGPFQFAAQTPNADGREPLVLTYLGEGRLEEHALEPDAHTLAMIRFMAPGLPIERIELPKDDACWRWSEEGEAESCLRVYFAPLAPALKKTMAGPVGQAAYVSVSRCQVFLGRAVIEAYVTAWLEHLGIEAAAAFEFGTPDAAIEFRAGPVGGQLLVDDRTTIEDLLHFAGLEKPLAQLRPFVAMELDRGLTSPGVLQNDGLYLPLVRRDEEAFEASSP
jgi:hypothetical protein